MPEIRFYHLQRTPPLLALPQLLDKALKQGRRIVIRTADQSTAEKLADGLWTYHPDSFLPHGTKADGNNAEQPIWITPGIDNPNGASVLILLAGCPRDHLENFDLVCDIFDGRIDDEVTAARTRWSALKQGPSALTYWQQGDNGWEKKAG